MREHNYAFLRPLLVDVGSLKTYVLLLYMPVKKTANRRSRGCSRKIRKTVKTGRPVVTVGLIYANWCGHCNALKPEWKKMKQGLRGTNCQYLEIEDADPHKDRKIAHVNSRLKGGKLVANGYPTVFKINNGKLEYYQGERTAPALQQWFKGGGGQRATEEGTLMQRFFGGKKQKGGCGCDKGGIMG